MHDISLLPQVLMRPHSGDVEVNLGFKLGPKSSQEAGAYPSEGVIIGVFGSGAACSWLHVLRPVSFLWNEELD